MSANDLSHNIFTDTQRLQENALTPSSPANAPGRPIISQGYQTISQLTALSGPIKGQHILLDGQEISIGRELSNHVQLTDPRVSRLHATIQFRQGKFFLRDRESSNGTFVNQTRIQERALNLGDYIEIGATVFQFELGRAPYLPDLPELQKLPQFEHFLLVPLCRGHNTFVLQGTRQHPPYTSVAIKVYRAPTSSQTFLRNESQILKTLRHPHIVHCEEIGQASGFGYIMMEFCAGGTLRDRMVEQQPMAVENAIKIIGEVCEALDYAHQQGIIHGDIKPENIMFDAADTVKLVDFGIANLTGLRLAPEDDVVIGSPTYLSYEQARGLPLDPRSDLYSLGVVLYELLTGRPPFLGQPAQVIHQHLTQIPPSPREFNPAIPERLAAIITQALSKDRRLRYQTAGTMLAAIGYPGINQARQVSNAYRPPVLAEDRTAIVHGSLHILSGPFRNQLIPLYEEVTVIGRRQINPEDKELATRHAQIAIKDHEWWLIELNPLTTTLHNGTWKVGNIRLRHRDELTLGNTLLRVEIPVASVPTEDS